MGLRHIKPGIAAARQAGTGIFHPTLRHPHTGMPLEAVGVVGDEILWPIMGGSPEDDIDPEADLDDGNDDGNDDGKDDDDDDADGDDDEELKDPKKAKAKITALTEEKDRHYKRRKKAETERDELRAELEKLKAAAGKKPKAKPAEKDDAGETDDTEDEEKAELRKQVEQMREEQKRLNVERAFESVTNNTKIDWVKPGQVMALFMADDDFELEFDDNGKIDRKSLTAELKRFAKANPHLVKPKEKQSDSNEGDTGNGKSGSPMNGQRKGSGKQAPTREQLAKKYPALGR